ncbi:Uncharacterized protein FKW44_007508, partial [Caligus rogercresseyi]
GLENGANKYLKATVLFGLSKNNRFRSPKSKAIEFSLLNCKAYIASCLSKRESLNPKILRSAMISAAARYTAFSLKIPSDTDDSWISAGNIIKFYPSKSKRYFNFLKRIMKHFN